MAKLEGDQTIPAELLELYQATLTEKQPDDITRSRYPFRVPTLQTLKGTPTKKQLAVREIFSDCVQCFAMQPDTGGVTPPTIGPRNRSWWFNDAIGSGLWYFDYFMQQTLDGYFAAPKVDWCWKAAQICSFVIETLPDTNMGGDIFLQARRWPANRHYSFIRKTAPKAKYLHLYWWGVIDSSGLPLNLKIQFFTIEQEFGEYSITWNNMPPMLNLIKTVSLEGWGNEWIKVEIPDSYGIGIKMLSSRAEGLVALFCSDDWVDETKRPYFT